MTLPMKVELHGRVIGPTPGSPNNSSDILKSSVKMLVLRYARGTSKRCPSLEYTTKRPFPARGAAVGTSTSLAISALILGKGILFLAAAARRHLLASCAGFLALIMRTLANQFWKGEGRFKERSSSSSKAAAVAKKKGGRGFQLSDPSRKRAEEGLRRSAGKGAAEQASLHRLLEEEATASSSLGGGAGVWEG
ncbi:hypothetical protein Taro_049397 [Colocasia esculenta]|uniref:Uncharacterized protein n=1 Tax=Colocasia esculenta TaxID=4460 RepID=A0A843XAZ0_COLES|nr:hypothetical protein [Colocasia esculenta]